MMGRAPACSLIIRVVCMRENIHVRQVNTVYVYALRSSAFLGPVRHRERGRSVVCVRSVRGVGMRQEESERQRGAQRRSA
jgi:hypothetical protein